MKVLEYNSEKIGGEQMKINLEVNTENIEEVSDAVKILNVFTKNDESFLEIKESDFSIEESKERMRKKYANFL